MSGTTPDSRIPQPFHPAWHTSLLDTCWPRVHVDSAHITTGASGDCASAVVQLGGLTPADVRVEIMRAAPNGATSTEHRLFSSHALGNGCFVFEATLPRSDPAAPTEWLIHVHPSEAVTEPRVEYRVKTGAP